MILKMYISYIVLRFAFCWDWGYWGLGWLAVVVVLVVLAKLGLMLGDKTRLRQWQRQQK